ncbi:hypothetical protein OH76DRAFT_1471916 [Lentinus brumalis]|uniref:Uncharacterized protein n=1 Tax=Lentinus brumalis TaxID=2498619 RepID=A0A371DAR2_9APHY|nr:hypothetical protein OH76DRAFT_1471916 [Polyporus brumalis]
MLKDCGDCNRSKSSDRLQSKAIIPGRLQGLEGELTSPLSTVELQEGDRMSATEALNVPLRATNFPPPASNALKPDGELHVRTTILSPAFPEPTTEAQTPESVIYTRLVATRLEKSRRHQFATKASESTAEMLKHICRSLAISSEEAQWQDMYTARFSAAKLLPRRPGLDSELVYCKTKLVHPDSAQSTRAPEQGIIEPESPRVNSKCQLDSVRPSDKTARDPETRQRETQRLDSARPSEQSYRALGRRDRAEGKEKDEALRESGKSAELQRRSQASRKQDRDSAVWQIIIAYVVANNLGPCNFRADSVMTLAAAVAWLSQSCKTLQLHNSQAP